MPYCNINSITSPSGSAAFDPGDSFSVRWTDNTACELWTVSEIKLQHYNGSAWSDVSTLWTGIADVEDGSEGISVTLANSYSNYGDAYRVRIKYADAEF